MFISQSEGLFVLLINSYWSWMINYIKFLSRLESPFFYSIKINFYSIYFIQ